LKIAIVSKDDKQLAEIARLLRERNTADSILITLGSLDKLTGFIETAPDVLVLDQPSVEGGDMDRLERLSNLYPKMACILTSRQHAPNFLMRAMRAGVREVLPSPAAADTLFPAIRRVEEKLKLHTQTAGKILAFVSCKGGSGATFLATNLGYALATLESKRVVLIDLNLRFGDASLFVSDNKPLATLADVAGQIHRLDHSLLAASMLNVTPNFAVLAAPEDPVHADDVKPEHIDTLLTLARQHYDFILLDVGRGLDAVSVRALDQSDMIFPVLQTTLPYVRDGKRLLEVFRSLDYRREKIYLIVNRHEKSSEIKLRDLETAYGSAVFMTIPNHYEAAAASVNHGVPVLKLAKSSPISRSLQDFARLVTGQAAKVSQGWFSRMFKSA
jgi:pilus assembly protein CpaE